MKPRLLVAAAVLLLAAAALWLIGGSARLLHPARYRVTGATILSPDLYAAAVARTVATPLAALRFPAGGGAVIAEAERATLWLDPPTALVLDRVAREPDAGTAAPLANPALTPAAVLARARGVVGAGPQLARLTWPTRRRSDWQVRFRGGTTVAVADDSGVAARARPEEVAALPTGAGRGAALTAGAALAAVALALVGWVLRRRRR